MLCPKLIWTFAATDLEWQAEPISDHAETGFTGQSKPASMKTGSDEPCFGMGATKPTQTEPNRAHRASMVFLDKSKKHWK